MLLLVVVDRCILLVVICLVLCRLSLCVGVCCCSLGCSVLFVCNCCYRRVRSLLRIVCCLCFGVVSFQRSFGIVVVCCWVSRNGIVFLLLIRSRVAVDVLF